MLQVMALLCYYDTPYTEKPSVLVNEGGGKKHRRTIYDRDQTPCEVKSSPWPIDCPMSRCFRGGTGTRAVYTTRHYTETLSKTGSTLPTRQTHRCHIVAPKELYQLGLPLSMSSAVYSPTTTTFSKNVSSNLAFINFLYNCWDWFSGSPIHCK